MKYIYTFLTLTISIMVHAQTFQWAANMGSAGYEMSNSIALDNNGNVYTTGSFSGTVDFDPGPGVFNMTSVANSEVFIQKLDNAGNLIFAIQIGAGGSESIKIDATGNIYVTGVYGSNSRF